MTTRADIAAALSAVPDVTGYEWRPAAPRIGDGWPLQPGYVRDERSSMMFVRWRVLVVVPPDERAASTWLDAHVDALFVELEPAGYIESIDPVELPAADEPTGKAVQVTMRSE